MLGNKRTQQIIIKADDKNYTAAMNRIKRQTRALSASFTKMGDIAKKAVLAIALPVGFAIRDFIHFDDAITRAGLAAGVTGAELDKLEDAARKAGKETQRSATDSAEALEAFALAGYNVEQSIALLRPALNLAVIAKLSVSEAAKAVTSDLKKFGGAFEDAGRFIEGYTYLQSQFRVEVAEMAYDLEQAAGGARSLGISFADAATLSGILREQLGEGTAAALSQLFANLVKNADAIKELGINIYDAGGNARPFGLILKDIENKTDGLSDALKNQILNAIAPNKRAFKGLYAALTTGADVFIKHSEAAAASSGVVDTWIKRLSENLKGYWKVFVSAMGEAGIALVSTWAESMKRSLAAATAAMNFLGENAETLGFIIKKVFSFSVALLGASLLAKAIVKIRLAMYGLITAFQLGRIAAASFWASATLGLSVLITFLPEIIAYLRKLGVNFEKIGSVAKGALDYTILYGKTAWKVWNLIGEAMRLVIDPLIGLIVYAIKISINKLNLFTAEMVLKTQEALFGLGEFINKWGEGLGLSVDLTGLKMEINRVKTEIHALNEEEITLNTGKAHERIAALWNDLDRLWTDSPNLTKDAKTGGLGGGYNPPKAGEAGAGIAGEDEGGGGQAFPDGYFGEGYDAPLTDKAEQQASGHMTQAPEMAVANAIGAEGTAEELETIAEVLDELAELELTKEEEKLKSMAELHAQHEEAMKTIKSKSASTQEKLDAIKYTKQYKAMESAQSSLMALQQAGVKEAGTLLKGLALAEMALKLATEPPAAFSKTFATFGYPLGAVLAPLAFAATAAQIVSAQGAVSRVGFREGGIAQGGLPGLDSIPAMLAPGEVIIPEHNFEDLKTAIQSEGGQDINVKVFLDGREIGGYVLDYFTEEGVL